MAANVLENFGGNIRFSPALSFSPKDGEEVMRLLDEYRGRGFRVGGSLHSWTPLVQTDDVFLSLRRIDHLELRHDAEGPLVTVGGGLQIKEILRRLAKSGLTLPALGLISEQTIAGAISTATHGSGRHCLSHYVTAVHVAHYDPVDDRPRITVVRRGEALRAARCSLGCLGVIVAVEFRPREAYRVEETLTMRATLDDVLAEEESTPLQQFFWLPWLDAFLGQHRRETEAPRSRSAPLYRAYWFAIVDVALHVVLRRFVRRPGGSPGIKWFFRRLAPLALIQGWRVVDRSQDALVMEHELFRHIEIELFVTRSRLPGAFALARRLVAHFDGAELLDLDTRSRLDALGLKEALDRAPGTYTHHYAVCVRRILSDDTHLSMAGGEGEDFHSLSFISYERPEERRGFLSFAEVLSTSLGRLFDARCHWGKVCPHSAEELRRLYPRLPAFVEVCERFDRLGRFRNAWIDERLFQK